MAGNEDAHVWRYILLQPSLGYRLHWTSASVEFVNSLFLSISMLFAIGIRRLPLALALAHSSSAFDI